MVVALHGMHSHSSSLNYDHNTYNDAYHHYLVLTHCHGVYEVESAHLLKCKMNNDHNFNNIVLKHTLSIMMLFVVFFEEQVEEYIWWLWVILSIIATSSIRWCWRLIIVIITVFSRCTIVMIVLFITVRISVAC